MNPAEQAQVEALKQTIHQRAEPMAIAVLDTLNVWCVIAADPTHPAFAQARQLISTYVKLQDRMRALATGIQLPGT